MASPPRWLSFAAFAVLLAACSSSTSADQLGAAGSSGAGGSGASGAGGTASGTAGLCADGCPQALVPDSDCTDFTEGKVCHFGLDKDCKYGVGGTSEGVCTRHIDGARTWVDAFRVPSCDADASILTTSTCVPLDDFVTLQQRCAATLCDCFTSWAASPSNIFEGDCAGTVLASAVETLSNTGEYVECFYENRLTLVGARWVSDSHGVFLAGKVRECPRTTLACDNPASP